MPSGMMAAKAMSDFQVGYDMAGASHLIRVNHPFVGRAAGVVHASRRSNCQSHRQRFNMKKPRLLHRGSHNDRRGWGHWIDGRRLPQQLALRAVGVQPSGHDPLIKLD
jgi:hypothetical protein